MLIATGTPLGAHSRGNSLSSLNTKDMQVGCTNIHTFVTIFFRKPTTFRSKKRNFASKENLNYLF